MGIMVFGLINMIYQEMRQKSDDEYYDEIVDYTNKFQIFDSYNEFSSNPAQLNSSGTQNIHQHYYVNGKLI
jgi:hypothetical protein